MIRRCLLALCSLAAVLGMSGCGEREEKLKPGSARPLRVALAPVNTGEGAVYAARDGGLFGAAGLKVTLTQAPDGASAIRQVQQGKADLAVGTQPDHGASPGRAGDLKEELRVERVDDGRVRVGRWLFWPGRGWELQEAPPMFPAARYAEALASAGLGENLPN